MTPQPPPTTAAALTEALRTRTTEVELDWIFALAEAATAAALPVETLRSAAAELAWLAREAGQRLPGRAEVQRCAETADPDLARLVLVYVHGQRLKADYRFAALAGASRDWLARFPDDGMVRALAAFGALGARHEGGQPLLARALAAPDADVHTRLVCLQGLWFATHLPDQPEQMLRLSDEMIGRGEDPHSLYYWRAAALRRLGRLDDATACIDRAIDLLPVGMTVWHQDYVRERELITATRFLTEHVERESAAVGAQLRADLNEYLAEIRTEIERQSADARRLVSGSLLSLVEVLGIFVAITGFLIASGAVVFRASGFWDGFAAVALLLTGALGFFLLLRFVVRFRVGPARGHR